MDDIIPVGTKTSGVVAAADTRKGSAVDEAAKVKAGTPSALAGLNVFGMLDAGKVRAVRARAPLELLALACDVDCTPLNSAQLSSELPKHPRPFCAASVPPISQRRDVRS